MQPPSHRLHPCAPELGWQSLCLGGILQEARKKKNKYSYSPLLLEFITRLLSPRERCLRYWRRANCF